MSDSIVMLGRNFMVLILKAKAKPSFTFKGLFQIIAIKPVKPLGFLDFKTPDSGKHHVIGIGIIQFDCAIVGKTAHLELERNPV